jgi:hypothetical protein
MDDRESWEAMWARPFDYRTLDGKKSPEQPPLATVSAPALAPGDGDPAVK